MVEPAVVRSWLLEEFRVRRQALDTQMRVDPRGSWCREEKRAALGFLDLPSQRDGRELTLGETLTEAQARLEVMHLKENDLALTCLTRNPPTNHRGGYLHNLWHRITGTTSFLG